MRSGPPRAAGQVGGPGAPDGRGHEPPMRGESGGAGVAPARPAAGCGSGDPRLAAAAAAPAGGLAPGRVTKGETLQSEHAQLYSQRLPSREGDEIPVLCPRADPGCTTALSAAARQNPAQQTPSACAPCVTSCGEEGWGQREDPHSGAASLGPSALSGEGG